MRAPSEEIYSKSTQRI